MKDLPNKKYADMNECIWIFKEQSTDPNIGYNILEGGQGGDYFANKSLDEIETIKIKMSNSKLGNKNPMFEKESPMKGKKNPQVAKAMKGKNNPSKRQDIKDKKLETRLSNKTKNKNCSSKYKGVSWHKKFKKYCVRISYYNNKRIFVGYFKDELEAAKAYDEKCLELYGQKALDLNMLNFDRGVASAIYDSE